MKLVLAEKPSAARHIADFLGAKEKMDGYYQGNGYQVSYAKGHLLSIGHAKDYGYSKWSDIPVPFFPDFKIFPTENKGDLALLNINKKLMNRADLIINATDAEREGELIFRYIYEYSGSKVPVKRLWISSLTNQALENGFRSLRNSDEFDKLYLAAKARNYADWLVGINGTTRLTLKTGIMYSLGRVQTPVLKLVVDRSVQNKKFKSIKFHQLALEIEDGKFVALNDVKYDDSKQVLNKLEAIKSSLNSYSDVIAADTTKEVEKPKNLYSLSTLQVDANRRFGFKADKTLKVAQSLYEMKVISYPRTDSQHLSTEMFAFTDSLFQRFSKVKPDIEFIADKVSLSNKKVFNDDKVSDHHAIIPTSDSAKSLSPDELKLYSIILLRFLSVFAADALKVTNSFELKNNDNLFKLSTSKYSKLGWKLLYGSENSYVSNFLELNKGDSIECKPIIVTKNTKPKPFFTDASLIIAMNTAGKTLESEEQLEAMKGKGLGTPATQASIIERLIKNDFIQRKGKSIISTSKGDELIDMLDMQNSNITSVELTGAWEEKISSIQKGALDFNTFLNDIKQYTKQLLADLEKVNPKLKPSVKCISLGVCPKCNSGDVKEGKKSYFCSNYSNKKQPCNFHIFKRIANRPISTSIAKQLIEKKKTSKLKFKSKKQVEFEAQIVLKDDFTATLVFSH